MKVKTKRIVVVVAKWRHRTNGLFMLFYLVNQIILQSTSYFPELTSSLYLTAGTGLLLKNRRNLHKLWWSFWQRTLKITNFNPFFVLCYLHIRLMFWEVILMFHSKIGGCHQCLNFEAFLDTAPWKAVADPGGGSGGSRPSPPISDLKLVWDWNSCIDRIVYHFLTGWWFFYETRVAFCH